MRWSWAGRALVMAVVALPAAPAWAAREARVTKTPVVVIRKTFDPGNPPKEMPPLGPRADAVTHFKFGCSANSRYEVTQRRRDNRGSVAVARINDMEVRLELEITIWVPSGARQKLIDHEEGHRVIAERIYATAEQAARAEARKLIGKTVSGRAGTVASAADVAVRDANHRFCQAYLEATSGWAGRVGDAYDEITDHGRRGPPVAEGIRLAFQRDADTHGTTPPLANRVEEDGVRSAAGRIDDDAAPARDNSRRRP